ncbi:antitoxin Xre/MbcA/ParS toxin-binding domain-containing protein [Marinobacter pelagius]|uniref:Putative toxin-antitoxin system antitoxin component, TIGR02293 family n=1 Tax=Marinobacter pelagius TaxID=379482 RepID=A0A1I4QNC2_9GAMM|nr:antitoxin Xre/MbcA/ParS toxin-binding domain-containing protein [Marinobacter pelagius]SFM41534.1 putative toxin-antitoxin system antitoxin component, TIGR02293 family [Marinobacter pelagius]
MQNWYGNQRGAFDLTEEYTVAQLRDLVYREFLELFEGDRAAAEQWLSSPIKVLGDRNPASLMETKAGVQKIRSLLRKWGEGAVS